MAALPAFVFNEKLFRDQFPAFANNVQFNTPLLEAYFGQAGYYVANNNYGPLARAGATLFALNLMTAHLVQLGCQISQGTDSGITIAAAIDKISTTLQEMELPNQWSYWLCSTEYGNSYMHSYRYNPWVGYMSQEGREGLVLE